MVINDLREGCRKLGADCFTICDLGMNLEAAVGLLLNLGERNRQLGDFFGRDDGEVLHVLCLQKEKFPMQQGLKQFLNHLHDADTRCDGMPREMSFVDGPLWMYAHAKGINAFLFLLRNDCIEVVL